MSADPVRAFAGMDIYLLDQVLRGRVAPGATICDAGCGRGRNVAWFLARGHPVYACDPDPAAVEAVRTLAPDVPVDHFRVEAVEDTTFPDALADMVILNAVLHFARDEDHFRAMVDGAWRLVRDGGLLFARLASTIGMEQQIRSVGGRRAVQPDGDERFLVDAAMLDAESARLGAARMDPLKTTVVQDRRAMTTWVLARPSRGP